MQKEYKKKEGVTRAILKMVSKPPVVIAGAISSGSCKKTLPEF